MFDSRNAIAGVIVVSCIACSSSNDDSSGTTGQAIALKTRAVVKDDLSKPFTNSQGWTVTLSEAYLSVGPLYYYTGDPVLSLAPRHQSALRSAWATLTDFLVAPAYAHPGHYIEGAAMGQMLTPTTLDLMVGSVNLADGEGVSGVANSARFTWQSPPQGKFASALNGHVVSAKGTAEKGDITLQFTAKADEPEVHDGNELAEVSGCAFGANPGESGVDMTGDGTVTLNISPSVWFDQIDFGYVAPGAAGAPAAGADGTIDIAGSLAWEGFVRGVKKGTAYEFTYSK